MSGVHWLRDTFALRSSRPGDLSGTRIGTRPHYLLQPANPLFIWGSLVVALLLNLLPWGRMPLIPDWLALGLIFWNVHQPRRVGIGAAFIFGLLMDVHSGALFGEHALGYTLVSYGAITLHRRMTWFPIGAQALHALPLLLIAQVASLAVRMYVGGDWPGWIYFAESAVGAALWPKMTAHPSGKPVPRMETSSPPSPR